ncbi:uncharacterized protein LOC117171217 [Belonocnema kinseyi]|uniref:uncharacterized protein LOC117171217 n=1 Tax=Belonocnema kinseyi TaxID=2817044 RepID=UPI00143D363A|nr:uncharacterized protein LOC117171217 [Belonocnema kinseyi]
MLSVQTLSKTRPLIVGVIGNQTRNKYTTIVCTPPRNRIPLPEKVAHGVAIFLSIFTFPMWIAANIKNYKQTK